MGGHHLSALERHKRLTKRLDRLRAAARESLIELQKTCPHDVDDLREVPYRTSVLGTHPPWRVCTYCGFAEEGWSCGWQFLGRGVYQVPEISRETALQMRRGRLHHNSEVFDVKVGRKDFEELYR